MTTREPIESDESYRMISVAEASRRMGISKSTTRKWVSECVYPVEISLLFGGRPKVLLSNVLKVVARGSPVLPAEEPWPPPETPQEFNNRIVEEGRRKQAAEQTTVEARQRARREADVRTGMLIIVRTARLERELAALDRNMGAGSR